MSGARTKKSAAACAASLQLQSCDKKLSPVEFVDAGAGRRKRPVPVGHKVSSTYVSIEATCPNACQFKAQKICYVRAGAARGPANRLDVAAIGRSSEEAIADEVGLIDRAFPRGVPQDGARGGRDLRLHVGGDVGNEHGARMLAGAADRWRARGGGDVWTFSHLWREIPRAAWGSISVIASVERAEDVEHAAAQGYAAALVVDKFGSDRAFSLSGTRARIVPCPAETQAKTCSSCRLCLRADALALRGVAIAFEAHGRSARHVREVLVQIGRKPIAVATDTL